MTNLLQQAEIERGIINSRRDQHIQAATHRRLNEQAQKLVDSGKFADLKTALLSLGPGDFESAYAQAGLQDANDQLAQRLT